MTSIQIRIGSDYTNGTKTPITATVQAGDHLSQVLVTDTIVWEVVKVTKSTVTIRRTKSTETVHQDTRCDTGAHGLGVVWVEQESDPTAATKTLRVRKDGTVRIGSHIGAHPLRPAQQIEGRPVARTDHRF